MPNHTQIEQHIRSPFDSLNVQRFFCMSTSIHWHKQKNKQSREEFSAEQRRWNCRGLKADFKNLKTRSQMGLISCARERRVVHLAISALLVLLNVLSESTSHDRAEPNDLQQSQFILRMKRYVEIIAVFACTNLVNLSSAHLSICTEPSLAQATSSIAKEVQHNGVERAQEDSEGKTHVRTHTRTHMLSKLNIEKLGPCSKLQNAILLYTHTRTRTPNLLTYNVLALHFLKLSRYCVVKHSFYRGIGYCCTSAFTFPNCNLFLIITVNLIRARAPNSGEAQLFVCLFFLLIFFSKMNCIFGGSLSTLEKKLCTF